jgi:hypothetical protein
VGLAAMPAAPRRGLEKLSKVPRRELRPDVFGRT